MIVQLAKVLKLMLQPINGCGYLGELNFSWRTHILVGEQKRSFGELNLNLANIYAKLANIKVKLANIEVNLANIIINLVNLDAQGSKMNRL